MGTPAASDGHVGFHEESTGERKYNTVTGGNRNALGERCWGSLLALPGGSKASYGRHNCQNDWRNRPKKLVTTLETTLPYHIHLVVSSGL